MPNFPIVIAYHAKILVKASKNKCNHVSKCSQAGRCDQYDYVVSVDLPDYYSNSDILYIIADQLGVRTVGDIIDCLSKRDVTIMVDNVNCPVNIQYGQFDAADGHIYNCDDVVV